METKILLTALSSCLVLSACGGSSSSAPPVTPPASTPVVEKPAPFLFTATNGSNGYELWSTEGTAETTKMVKDINASGDSDIQNIIRVGKLSFFKADDGVNGNQLWVSDGTDSGTIALATNPGEAIEFKGQLFFIGGDSNDVNNSELWKTDGTVAGTTKVKEINAGSASGANGSFAILSDTLYFSANDGSNGDELWKTDGTESGTVMAADIRSGSGSSNPLDPIVFANKLLFSAYDGTNGQELWSFDGTTASLLKNIYSGSSSSSPLGESAVIGNTLFFTALSNTHGLELWKTDGTSAGTVIAHDTRTGSRSSSPRELTVVGSDLFFTATNGTNGRELWKTDGTTTSMVKNINTTSTVIAKSAPAAIAVEAVSSDFSSNPQSLVAIAGKLYFQANTGTDTELWVSDGTDAGTVVLKDIYDGGSSEPMHLGYTQYANKDTLGVANVGVLFSATTATHGRELWKSDGTAAGTTLVKDLNPDASNGMPGVAR